MKVAIYVAMAENGVIGRDNGLPWKLSTDLRRFKATTMGKPIIMGRKTWQSIGRPLPGRLNIVVTSDPDFRAEGAEIVGSLDDGVKLATLRGRCMAAADEVCVVGGGEIYRQALPMADRLYVTHILESVDGDTRFPSIDPAMWEVVSEEEFPAGEKDTHATRYTVYERREAVH
jgi:dihydrofolate reductase